MASSTIPGLANSSGVTSAYTWPASDGLGNDVEVTLAQMQAGIGGVLTSVPVPAAAMRPSQTGGCAALALVATASNQPDVSSLDFDATTKEYAQFAIVMPLNWDRGTIQAAFGWSHAATTTNFQVRWGIQAVAISDDETLAVAFGTAQEVTDTGGTTDKWYWSAKVPAVTIAGSPAAEDLVVFRVYRDPGHAADTMAIDARLMFVKLYLTFTTTNEA